MAKLKKPIQTLTDLRDQDEYSWLDCDQIDRNPNQDRLDWESDYAFEKYENLKSSILHDGKVKREIEVYLKPDGRYEIIAGERRWRICVELGCPKIPAVTRKDITPEQASIDMLTESEHHSPLSLIERALAFKKRQDSFGMSIVELSEKTGIEARRIYECTSVLKLDEDLLDVVKNNFTRDLKVVLGLGRLKDKDPNIYRQGLALLSKNELTRETLKTLEAQCACKAPAAKDEKPPLPSKPLKSILKSRWSYELSSQIAYPLYCKAMGLSAYEIDPNSEAFERVFHNFIKRLINER